MKHIKTFEAFSNQHELTIDYEEAIFRMYRYVEDEELVQTEYYGILDSKISEEDKFNQLMDLFNNNIIDEDNFYKYLPDGGNLEGFCKYLIDNK